MNKGYLIGFTTIMIGAFCFSFDGFLWICLGIMLICSGGVIAIDAHDRETGKRIAPEDGKNIHNERIRYIFDHLKINATQVYKDTNLTVIGIDEINKKVVILKSNSNHNYKTSNLVQNDGELFIGYETPTSNIKYESNVYEYSDILESEVITDGVTVTKTSRSSQIGRAILGGIIAGGVGTIVGGLSGKTNSKDTVSSIKLRLFLNDTSHPYEVFNFLEKSSPIDKNKPYYHKVNDDVMRWHAIFKAIINEADKEDKGKNRDIDTNPKSDIPKSKSDEIRELYKLYTEGIITKDEYTSEKTKLLNE